MISTGFTFVPDCDVHWVYIGDNDCGLRPLGYIVSDSEHTPGYDVCRAYAYIPPFASDKLYGTYETFKTFEECLAYLTGLVRALGIKILPDLCVTTSTSPCVERILYCPIDEYLQHNPNRPEA